MKTKSPPVISSISVSPQSGPGGTTFTASVAASGFPPLKYRYQWKLNGVEILGATGASYVASSAGTLTVVVRASNNEGETVRESAAVQVTPSLASPSVAEAEISPSSGTVGNLFTAVVAASGVPVPQLRFQWLMDGVEIGGATSFSYAAIVAGNLSVRVTATNSEGTDSLESAAVTVGNISTRPVITEASISPATGRVNDVFTANATVTGDPAPVLSYQWSLDGVAIDGATSATYRAGAQGTLALLITASNSAGNASATAPAVLVEPALSAPAISAASIAPTSGRVGDVFTASATATGNPTPVLSYQWYLDDAAIAGAIAATYTAGGKGSLSVAVTASNSEGSATATAPGLIVEPALAVPVISEPSISPASGYVGDVFAVSATATGNPAPAVTYQWTLDGMAIGGATEASYTAGAQGTLAVVVTASNSQGSDSEMAPGIPVAPALTGPTFWSANVAPTAGHVGDIFTANATVTGNPPPALSYQWMLNGGAIDGATELSYEAASEGTLAVVITASNSEGMETATSPAVLVKAALAAPVISGAIISPSTGNVGDVFTASASVAGNPTPTVSFQWTLNGLAIDGAVAKSFTAAAEGALAVTVRATNSVGTASTTAPGVVVKPALTAPLISAASISPATGHVGDTFAASAEVTGNPVPELSYRWFLDGTAIDGAMAGSYVAEAVGSLMVAVTAANSEGTISATSPAVAVAEALVAPSVASVSIVPSSGRVGDTFTASAEATGNPAPALAYQWALDGVTIPGATSASYLAEAVGSLTMTVSAANSEGASSATSAAVEVLASERSVITGGNEAIIVERLATISPLVATLSNGVININNSVQQ